MADTARTLAALQTLLADNSAGNITAQNVRDFLVSAYQPQRVCNGRLTLESGVPVSTSDQTAKTTVYFTPYGGNCIGVYDGASWKLWTFAELSLALGTLTSGKNYDLFAYDNSGTLALILGPAWSSDTARGTGAGTTELTTQDGVYVNNVSISGGPGAKAGRYLGTLRTTSATATEDSAVKRFVWNAQNRVSRQLLVTDATASWTYGTATWRQARASSANQAAAVVGLVGTSLLDLTLQTVVNPNGGEAAGAIGEDSTTTPDAACVGRYVQYSTAAGGSSRLVKRPGLGYHFWAWLEQSVSAGSMTFFGISGDYFYSGLIGSLET